MGSSFSFHTAQILPVSDPSGNSSSLAMYFSTQLVAFLQALTTSTLVPARRCPSLTSPQTLYQEEAINWRISFREPKEGGTNKRTWKCQAPRFCIPILQNPAKCPYSL